MTYSSGGLIQAADYNTLATTVNNQWSTGTSNHGLGQGSISAVAAGNSVTAAQWNTLIGTTNNMLHHEGQTLITPSSVNAGDLITAYSAITTGVTAAYDNSGSTTLGLSTLSSTAASTTLTWGGTQSTNHGLLFTHVVTFATPDAARYFFNAGGRLSLSYSRTGGSATTQNTAWSNLCAACGSIQMTSSDYVKVGGSGTVSTLLHTGYYGLTGSAVRQFLQFDATATYTSDSIQTHTYWGGTAGNGGYNTIYFNTYWIDNHTNAYSDYVNGTSTTTLTVSGPATTYLANTWGTPTVSQSTALY